MVRKVIKMEKDEFKELVEEFVSANHTVVGQGTEAGVGINNHKGSYFKAMDELYEDVLGCKACKYLMELFKRIEKTTNRDYWVMTELFMLLHDGKDYCNVSKRKSVYIESEETIYNPFPKGENSS